MRDGGNGILVCITQLKLDAAAHAQTPRPGSNSSLERATEHCLAVRQAIHKLLQSVLHQMSDMLMLEIGPRLSGIAGVERLGGAN